MIYRGISKLVLLGNILFKGIKSGAYIKLHVCSIFITRSYINLKNSITSIYHLERGACMIKYKKTLLILISLLMLTFCVTSNAADDTEERSMSSGSEQSISLSGTIVATVIEITVPTNVTFTIDPNADTETERFVCPDFVYTNNSAIPVVVDVKDISFLTGESLHAFTTVVTGDGLPDGKTWDSLSVLDSKKYIALGLYGTTTEEWQNNSLYATKSSPFWSTGSVFEPVKHLGVLPERESEAQGSEGTLSLIAHHGLAFDSKLNCNISLTLIFSLQE